MIKRKKGFNLIEVVVSIALVSMTAIYMMYILSKGHVFAHKTLRRTIAGFLAQEKIEELYLPAIPAGSNEAPVVGFPDHTRTVTVTNPVCEAPLGGAPGYCYTTLSSVVVTVSWNSLTGVRSVTFPTFVCDFY